MGAAVLTLVFPEAHLSADLPTTSKKTEWLPRPNVGYARYVQLLYTLEDEPSFRAAIERSGEKLVWHHKRPCGETIIVTTALWEFEHPGLLVPASYGSQGDLAMPPRFKVGQQRRVGFLLFEQPDEARVLCFSGFWIAAGKGAGRYPSFDTLTRQTVVQSSADQTVDSRYDGPYCSVS
jgi:hypothetical protein